MRQRPTLETDDVQKIMTAARNHARANGWSVAIAIVDDGGYLLHFERMDGVAAMSAEVAVGKARASALARRPTKELENRINERAAFLGYFHTDRLAIQGALPILVDGECAGAVGVSGRPSEEDETVASVGIAGLSRE